MDWPGHGTSLLRVMVTRISTDSGGLIAWVVLVFGTVVGVVYGRTRHGVSATIPAWRNVTYAAREHQGRDWEPMRGAHVRASTRLACPLAVWSH